MEAFQFCSSIETFLFGKGVLVDLQMDELEPHIANTEPDGLFIRVPAEEKDQPDFIKRLKRW
jgi:hypothetical protein